MNSKKKWFIFLPPIIFLIGIVIVLFFNFDSFFDDQKSLRELLFIAFFLCFLLTSIIIQIIIFSFIKFKRIEIQRKYDLYYDSFIAHSGVGILFFNNDFEIIWASEYLYTIFSNNIIGKKVTDLDSKIQKKVENRIDVFTLNINSFSYEFLINYSRGIINIKDITDKQKLFDLYWENQNVFAEIEVDNYDALSNTLSTNDIFKVLSNISYVLESLTKKYEFIYTQHSNGKFFVITNTKVLNEFISSDFNFINEIKLKNEMDNINVTLSVGFSSEFNHRIDLLNAAKKSLAQSKSRGGDQITIQNNNNPPTYYGAKSKLKTINSRVKLKKIAFQFLNLIKSNSIKNIIVYGHINADLDAIGAALGVYQIAKLHNVPCYIQNEILDYTTKKYVDTYLDQATKDIFISPRVAQNKTTQKTIIVIVDTADLKRIENPSALKKAKLENVYIFDHHRINKYLDDIPKNNIYIDPYISSTSEIITEIMFFNNLNTHNFERQNIQMLLNGIYLDTKSFKKTVSSFTFKSASWLEEIGADPLISSEILKIPSEFSEIISNLLIKIEEIKPNFFLLSTTKELSDDIISILADEILKVEGRLASFVIAKIPKTKKWKLSARSNNVNVQIIAEAVGGGGHFDSAAAVSDESLEIFKDNIIQAIISKTQSFSIK